MFLAKIIDKLILAPYANITLLYIPSLKFYAKLIYNIILIPYHRMKLKHAIRKMKTKNYINKHNKNLFKNIYVEKKEDAIFIFYYFVKCSIIFELISILIISLKFGFTKANILVFILTILMYLIILISKFFLISLIIIFSYFVKCWMFIMSIKEIFADSAFLRLFLGILAAIWLFCIAKIIDSIYLYSKLKKNLIGKKMLDSILFFFSIKYSDIINLTERLERMGTNSKSLIDDYFILLNVLEFNNRTDWNDQDKFIKISNYLTTGKTDKTLETYFQQSINDNIHRKFRDAIKDVDFGQLRKQWKSAKYYELIQEHIRKSNLVQIEMAILGTISEFSNDERIVLESLSYEIIQKAEDNRFFRKKLISVFDESCSRFQKLSNHIKLDCNDKILFSAFNTLFCFKRSIK